MIDHDDFSELVARERRLYHLHRDATHGTIASILEHGLDRVGSTYTGFWESRASHVYLGRPPIIKKMIKNHQVTRDFAIFSIDVSRLEPKKINPDEDHFAFWSQRGLKVTQQFRLQPSPAKWTWDWAKYLGIRPPPSLGEWAEAVSLGSNPAQTSYSARCGSLSYRGVVPASALRLEKTDIAIETAR